MAITTTTPYKSGTLSSIGTGANGANTRLHTSGITWAAGDVGRQVYFYSGNAQWESREIIAQGTNYCDIEFAFGTFPVDDADGVEVPSDAPSASDSVGVSYELDDLDDGTTLIKDNAYTYRHVASNGWTIGGDVMVHDVDKHIEWDSNWLDLDGIMQLGRIDTAGNPINQCTVRDVGVTSGGFSQTNNKVSTADDFGSFRMYGGAFNVVNTTHFLRMYRASGTSECNHVHGVNFDGAFGGRFDGTKSYWLDTVYSNLVSTIGPVNPKSNVALVKDIRVNSGTQVVYHNWSLSLSITQPGLRFEPSKITSQLIRTQSSSTGQTLTFDDIVMDDVEALDTNGVDIVDVVNTVTGGSDIKFSNQLSVRTQNDEAGFRLRIKNDAGTEVYDADSDGSGDWATASYEWGTITVISIGTYALSDAVVVGPYTCNARKYDKLTQTFDFDARANQLSIVPDVDDTTITEATEATVAAYTELDNLDKLRDRHKYEHVENDDVEDVVGGAELSFETSTNIETSYSGYNLTIDATAGSAWAISTDTVTIKASTLAVGTNTLSLTPYGTLTFSNGAVVSCPIVVGNGGAVVSAESPASMTGDITIQSNGRVDLADVTTDKLAGTGASGGRIKVNGATTTQTLDLTDMSLSATGFEVENNSGTAITVIVDESVTLTEIETSGTITVENPVATTNITAPNIIDGSKYLVFINDVATGGLQTVSGGSGIDLTYTKDTDYTSGQSWEIWIVYYSAGTGAGTCKQNVTLSGQFGSTDTEVIRTETQTDCPVYVALGWDGADYEADYSIDTANDEVDIDISGDFDVTQLFSYLVYAQTVSEAQLLDLYGEFVALDVANYYFKDDHRTLRFDNTTASKAKESSDARWYTLTDDGDPIKAPTSGGGAIDLNWREKVYIAETGVSGLTPTESAKLLSLDTADCTVTTNNDKDDYTISGTIDTLDGLNNFDPANDTVARVTLVDTTTTNTDMRGTDGANTTTPDNTSITAIKAKTDNLPADPASETNVDATVSETVTAMQVVANDFKADVSGLSTFDSTSDSVIVGTNNDKDDYTISGTIDTLDGLNNFDPTNDTVARVTLVDTTTTNTDMRGTDSANTTAPDNASITAIKERTDNLPDTPASKSDTINASQL